MSLKKTNELRLDVSKILSDIVVSQYSKSVISAAENENGCFCDFFGGQKQISTEDFADIEKSIESKLSVFCKVYSVSGLMNKEHADAQRLSVMVYENQKELDEKIKFFEEAEMHDHATLGSELDLFFIDSHNMPGAVNWLPNGTILLNRIKDFISKIMDEEGYQEVMTPFIARRALWETSGHWQMFKKNMFVFEDEDDIYAIKPMSCPMHINIFNRGNKSYRDLPYRLREFGFCTRNEASGALDRLFRVRSFTQDDAHVFCTQSQIEDVVNTFFRLVKKTYFHFGFDEISVCLSTRPEIFHGTIDQWNTAEGILSSVIEKSGFKFKIEPGDGAFYGPKIDFHIKDRRGRLWQCSTVQLDFFLGERFDATYVDSDGAKKHPVIVHHAIFGSLERFAGILIENCGGSFPFWLAPVQVLILPINENINEYSEEVRKILTQKGFTCQIYSKNEGISHKIAFAHSKKIPVVLILGKSEMESSGASMRIFGQEGPKNIPLEEMLEIIKNLKDNGK